MTQTPPTGPTPTGGQPTPGFPPPSYQPPNAAPPAQPPTYQPPAAGVPGQPPAGPPQPPSAPPGGGFAPNAYPPQPGYPQPGYPQAGYPQAPAGKASSSKVLIIVIAAVVALALLGGGLMLLAKTPQPTPPVTPTQPTQPTQGPTEQPTQGPTEQPTEGPTEGPTEQPQPPSGVIDLTHGVQFQVAQGFEIMAQQANAIKVTDGNSILRSLVEQVDPKTNPLQACDSLNRSILKEVSGAQFADPEAADLNASNLSGGKCIAVYVDASGGSSMKVYLQTFVGVRVSDGVTTAQSVLFTEKTPKTSFEAIDEMLAVVLTSQAQG